MKWINPSKEKIKFPKHIALENGIFFYGAGAIGRRHYQIAKYIGNVKAYVESKLVNEQFKIGDIPVISVNDMINIRKDELIVITAGAENTKDIINILNSMHLEKGKDYVTFGDFYKILAIMLMTVRNQVFVEFAQLSLTERCTLKCKKCAHACNYVPSDNKDMSLSQAFESADYFFKYTDFIQEFVLIGGEPFLYKNIDDVIKYIGDKYRKKINIFSIATNGTIIPRQSTIQLCQEYNMLIRISNYISQIPSLGRRHDEIKRRLSENGVEYILGPPETSWWDYGFENVDNGNNVEKLIQHFDECHVPCREVNGSKYYYCIMAHTVGQNMKHKGYNPNDCLELDKLDELNGKRIFYEYNQGYSTKGYLDMCQYCNGRFAFEKNIPAAEQMK